MSEGCDAGESSPSAAASASPGSAGVCVGTGTVEDARFCWAKCTASVTESVANGSASAWGADPPRLAALEGDAALAAEGDAGDTPGFGSVGDAGLDPGVSSVPASKSTQSTREGVRLLVGAAWSTGGTLPSTAAANGSTAAVSSPAKMPFSENAAFAVGENCGEDVPAVPVGDSARRAVAAAIAAAMDPEEDCLRGIPIPAPDPESNPEAEPEGEKADGVGENAVGEKLEAGDGDGAVGDGVPEWYAPACTSMDMPPGEVEAL